MGTGGQGRKLEITFSTTNTKQRVKARRGMGLQAFRTYLSVRPPLKPYFLKVL